jgi:hypothetical protein
MHAINNGTYAKHQNSKKDAYTSQERLISISDILGSLFLVDWSSATSTPIAQSPVIGSSCDCACSYFVLCLFGHMFMS